MRKLWTEKDKDINKEITIEMSTTAASKKKRVREPVRYYTWLVKLTVSANKLAVAEHHLCYQSRLFAYFYFIWYLHTLSSIYWHCKIFNTLYFTIQSGKIAIQNNLIVLWSYDWIFWFFFILLTICPGIKNSDKLPAQNIVDMPSITPDCLFGTRRSRVWPLIILSRGREQPLWYRGLVLVSPV